MVSVTVHINKMTCIKNTKFSKLSRKLWLKVYNEVSLHPADANFVQLTEINNNTLWLAGGGGGGEERRILKLNQSVAFSR